MISAQAKNSLDHMLVRGISSALPSPNGQQISVQIGVAPDESITKQAVALTICSLRFRAMVLIHYADDRQTKAYFANVNRIDVDELDERTFRDAVGECANICVGSMNRDLAPHFVHVGMSTPNFLDRNCVRFLAKLGEGHVQHFAITVPEGPQLQATLCMNPFADIDFNIQPSSTDTETSGELEMF